MRLQLEPRRAEWWFWAVTLVLICAALAGWSPGYAAVMLVSAVQVVWFAWATRSLASFPSQVRIVYLAIALLALWAPARAWVFGALAIGTAMVTLLGRCAIARALARMPWNRASAAACELPPAEARPRARTAGHR